MNKAAAAAYKRLACMLREFELEEWTDRVKNYPTGAKTPKYRLGELLFLFAATDEAIAAFQQTKIAPAFRSKSMLYLGKCYTIQGWHEEATAAFEEGIANHGSTNDPLGMELGYCKMDAIDLLPRRAATSIKLAKLLKMRLANPPEQHQLQKISRSGWKKSVSWSASCKQRRIRRLRGELISNFLISNF